LDITMLLIVVESRHWGKHGCRGSSRTITQHTSVATRYSSSHGL